MSTQSLYATAQETVAVMRCATADEAWLNAQLNRIAPHRGEIGDNADLMALEVLVFELRDKLRLPVEAADPDIGLSDCVKAIDYYRAGLEERAPIWVPSRVLLNSPVRGDYPIGHTTLVEAGEHDCKSNRYGAISVIATNGQTLGVKPAEFEPLEWRRNNAI